MTDKEVLKLALEALEKIIDAVYVNSDQEAIAVKHANIVITALKKTLAQPEQEPVAWETVYETIIHWDEGGGKRSRRELAQRIIDLYTHPPQRTEPLIGCVNHDCDKCREKNT